MADLSNLQAAVDELRDQVAELVKGSSSSTGDDDQAAVDALTTEVHGILATIPSTPAPDPSTGDSTQSSTSTSSSDSSVSPEPSSSSASSDGSGSGSAPTAQAAEAPAGTSAGQAPWQEASKP